VKSIKDCETNIFSESDFEAFDFAWNQFGQYNQFELAELAHKYPEWKKHEKTLEDGSRVRMHYKDFFEDPPENVEKCHPLEPEEKEDRLSHLDEIARIESLWS
jgi:hypothetical protein